MAYTIIAVTDIGMIVGGFSHNGRLIALNVRSFKITLFGARALSKVLDPRALAIKHYRSTISLFLIGEKYLYLLNDLIKNTSDYSELIIRRDELVKKTNKIYSGAPNTVFRDYKNVLKKLQEVEKMTFSKEGLTCLLLDEMEMKKQKNADEPYPIPAGINNDLQNIIYSHIKQLYDALVELKTKFQCAGYRRLAGSACEDLHQAHSLIFSVSKRSIQRRKSTVNFKVLFLE